jgi:hypothetical protein
MAKQDDYVKTALRLPPALHASLTRSAAERGRSLNAEFVARLERSFEAPSEGNDQQLENSVTLKAMRDALVDIARNANVHEDATRAMGRDLYALCREALPLIGDEQVRTLMHKLGDVGSAMQADDLADAQGRLRALFYLAMEYAGRQVDDRPSAD